MITIYSNTDDLINSMIKINSSWVLNKKSNKLPISCKYYLTILDVDLDPETNSFFKYIEDEERILEYPFKKDNSINYSMMLEIEQFYNIELNSKLTIKDISNNIDLFMEIVSESNGKIVFVLDIDYLSKFIVKLKNNSQPNHLIDMILFKLRNQTKSEISEILILDKNNIIKNKSNILYLQLKMCLKNENIDLEDKSIMVYKPIDEILINNVFWNILYEPINITEQMKKIKSPYDETYYTILEINGAKCFVQKTILRDIVQKNLFDLDKNPGIIIEPIDRLYF